MAYNAVSQGDHAVSPGLPPSPLLEGFSHRPASADYEEMDGETPLEHITAAADPTSGRVGSLMQSLTSTRSSYDMVEDDDYENPQVAPLDIRKRSNEDSSTPTRARFIQTASQPHSPERAIPFRSASITQHTPLRHPVPDLQSMQGAYVTNVDRLEESAERLSMSSSLDEELQKMKLEQRRPSLQNAAPANRVSSGRSVLRKTSSGSAANSIIDLNNNARSGGYSPSGYITSPRESAFSGSWSQPSKEGRPTSKGSRLASQPLDQERKSTPLDFAALTAPPVLAPPQFPPNAYRANVPTHGTDQEDTELDHLEEPLGDGRPTSASEDTYHQATDLFVDFDGVHFTPHLQLPLEQRVSRSRHVSLTQPPLASDPTSFQEPQPGERMVYYPAPVPMMLNLPQKLSKESTGQRERRRLQGISEIPDEMRDAAPWLQGETSGSLTDRRNTKVLSGLPPQLRASAFFDQPAASQDVKVKEASAVFTLDSILDASAHAPVSAFTDHPIAGQSGREIYAKPKPRRKSANMDTTEKVKKKPRASLGNMFRTTTGLTSSTRALSGEPLNASKGRIASRESKALETEEDAEREEDETIPFRGSEDLDQTARQSIEPGDDELVNEQDEGGSDEEEEDEEDDDELDMDYIGAPTTLLAELQMRKAQQKTRNRTANGYPNGMRATLLELDAIAQLQQKSRKQKHITLAWEDQDQAERENFDDDDVPLALLVPQSQNDVNRPIGLMEKRHIEDNEPLSHRRAKLRGEPLRPRGTMSQYQASMHTVEQPDTEDAMDEREGETLKERVQRLKAQNEQESETLGQRARRLKAGKEPVADMASDFAKEISSQLGLQTEIAVAPAKTPDPEETMGQRRKRLQQEALANGRGINGGDGSNIAAPPLQTRHSAATMLTANHVAGTVRPSLDACELSFQNGVSRHYVQSENVPFSRANHQAVPGIMQEQYSYNNTAAYANGSYSYGAPTIYSPTAMGAQYGMKAMAPYTPDPMNGPPLDPKSRIDTWRQSVVR